MFTPEDIRQGVSEALVEALQDEEILRDLFAAVALNGALAACADKPQLPPCPVLVGAAYEFADAMLEARRRPPKQSKLPT